MTDIVCSITEQDTGVASLLFLLLYPLTGSLFWMYNDVHSGLTLTTSDGVDCNGRYGAFSFFSQRASNDSHFADIWLLSNASATGSMDGFDKV